jgi:CRISPR-associated protein Cmr3
MTKQQWAFNPFDTVFFKESRPMESIGGSELNSFFPPPARALLGAIRTTIGDTYKVNWHEYGKDPDHPLRKIIGTPETPTPLSIQGPFLIFNNERLYPVPLAFLATGATPTDSEQTRLIPSAEAIECDLGNVQLPAIENKDLMGAKAFVDYFVTAKGLQEFLSCKPISEPLQNPNKLFSREKHLGIAQDSKTRTVKESMLYQTQHIRPYKDLRIGLNLCGFDMKLGANETFPNRGILTLGAEAKIADWQITEPACLPNISKPSSAKGLLLMLLSPALFKNGWCPDGFTEICSPNGTTQWRGIIEGIALTIECSVIGKPQREGGWNMAAKTPRAVSSYVPAGSCYFCMLDDQTELEAAQQKLHGVHIGSEQEYGRGELAVGYWY